MAKYRKKPVVIEAVQFTGRNILEITTFIDGAAPDLRHPIACEHWSLYAESVVRDGLVIRTLEDGKEGQAKHVASPGDWIIKGVKGEFYPCKPDIFAATYEPVEDSGD